MQKSPLLEVTVGDRANRPEAIRQAKAETELFIVWLQLQENLLANPNRTDQPRVSGQVWINFAILTPGTGKIKYSGTVYLGDSISGVGGRSAEILCYPGVRGDDALLLKASLEVAARIMDYFSVPVPAACS